MHVCKTDFNTLQSLFFSVAPYNVDIMGDTTYSQGNQLLLNCSSEGGPQLEYTWLFSGSVIANTNTLTITNVNTSHGGEYTCNVTNDAGYDSDTVTVYSELFVDQIKLHKLFYCLMVVTYLNF